MKIVYVGTKESKGDNIAATGLVWARGQIHEVEDEVKCAKLLEHPLIWRNADEQYELMPELKAVTPVPVVKIIPDATDPFVDPFIAAVPVDVVKKLHAKELIPVFMSSADADAFAEWKLERDTRPDEAPRETGPAVERVDKRTKEYKQGLNPKAA